MIEVTVKLLGLSCNRQNLKVPVASIALPPHVPYFFIPLFFDHAWRMCSYQNVHRQKKKQVRDLEAESNITTTVFILFISIVRRTAMFSSADSCRDLHTPPVSIGIDGRTIENCSFQLSVNFSFKALYLPTATFVQGFLLPTAVFCSRYFSTDSLFASLNDLNYVGPLRFP